MWNTMCLGPYCRIPDASFATLSPEDFRICFDEAKALCMAITQLKVSQTHVVLDFDIV